jgi:hypothetical protein
MYRSKFSWSRHIRRSMVSFMSRPLYPVGKSPLYQLDKRLRKPQSRSGRSGEDSTETRTPDHTVVQLLASRVCLVRSFKSAPWFTSDSFRMSWISSSAGIFTQGSFDPYGKLPEQFLLSWCVAHSQLLCFADHRSKRKLVTAEEVER